MTTGPFGAIAPLAWIVSDELTRKLETDVSLTFEELRASDRVVRLVFVEASATRSRPRSPAVACCLYRAGEGHAPARRGALRAGRQKASRRVALANKNTRTAWEVLARGVDYDVNNTPPVGRQSL